MINAEYQFLRAQNFPLIFLPLCKTKSEEKWIQWIDEYVNKRNDYLEQESLRCD